MPKSSSLADGAKTYYRPIEAAIRWSGLLRFERRILATLGQRPHALRKLFFYLAGDFLLEASLDLGIDVRAQPSRNGRRELLEAFGRSRYAEPRRIDIQDVGRGQGGMGRHARILPRTPYVTAS